MQILFKCDFEKGILCDGLNTEGNAWLTNMFAVKYDKTGPSKAANGDWYVYYEKSNIGSPTLTYTQRTPIQSSSIMLTFNFHAYGKDMKSFSKIFEYLLRKSFVKHIFPFF